MKRKKIYLWLLLFCISWSSIKAQEVKFTLNYNEIVQRYEILGKPDFTDENFFVGGGSQLSILLPTGIVDYSLAIESVAGGPWTDNSQIYTPSVDRLHDYHGIATNGSRMIFEEGKETLLFHFKLPGNIPPNEVRLFNNLIDPSSDKPGMGGGDFCNYYACALTLENVYGGVYPEGENIFEGATNVPTDVETAIIPSIGLFQNQPNPFKLSTLITYTLPIKSEVTLTIRDEEGKLLKTIKRKDAAGMHTQELLGKDFPTGLLFYQIETAYGSASKKMIHIR